MQTTDENSNKYNERQLFLAPHAHWIYCTLGPQSGTAKALFISI